MKNICRVSLVVVILTITSFQSAILNAQVTPGTGVASLEALFDLTEPDEGRAAYDPRTGEVFVAIGGPGVAVFLIESTSNSDIFRIENFNNDSGLGDFSVNGQLDTSAIGILNLDGLANDVSPAGLPVGVFNLGPILQPNANILTADDFVAAFPNVEVATTIPGLAPEFRSGINVLVVPEPSSFIGLATLLVTSCCTRRRQGQH